MNDGALDIAKRDVEIYRKELMEEWNRFMQESINIKKNMTGKPTEDFATTLVNLPMITDLRDRVIQRMSKLIQAYDTYTRLLEEKIGK